MKIESKDTDIESLLDGSYFFIPRFQRPYSWDDENINEFWDDVITNRTDDYFIGSMVVFKKTKQQYGVVDGQQRLTTISILLCVIRDIFEELGHDDFAEGVHQLIERKDRSNQNEFVLKTETSFPYFQEHILKFKDSPDLEPEIKTEEENLKNAHTLFKKFVGSTISAIDADLSIGNDKKAENKLKKLLEIRDAVLNLNLIFITLENEDDAYLIFETLNTRGKDLSLTDLVKNHFTKHLKIKSSVDPAKIKWEQMLDTIHNSAADISPDYFIYHFWASRYEATPLKKLFPKIKKQITKSKAKDYLNFLVSDSKLYRSMYETTYMWDKNEKDVVSSLEAFNLFKLAQPTPAILSLIRAYRDGKIKFSTLRNTLRSIEKFHFSFTAITSSRSSGGISAMYSSFGKKLYESNSTQIAANEIQELIQKLKDRVPSFDEFKVAFREVNYTNSNSKQKNLVRYILRNFSKHYGCKFPDDMEELTVEHIHPQSKIDSAWNDSVVGSLGNLIFLDEEMNQKIATKDFTEKKRIMQEASYTLPEFIINTGKWTPAEVLDHTDEMAAIAYNQIWKI